MSQGRHVGKLVLEVGDGLGGGTVLVTGGTGGVGSLVARHLVTERGVKSLLLASRRGTAADGVPELVADLEGAGAAVRVVACDVADRAAVADLLADLPGRYPLTAVVHAAGALADGTVTYRRPCTWASRRTTWTGRPARSKSWPRGVSGPGRIGRAGQGCRRSAWAAPTRT